MSDPRTAGTAMSDLRSHIGGLDAEAPERRHLHGLADDIEARLGRSSDDGAPSDELTERMNASVLQFEATHPKIAALLNELTDQLGKMGI